MEHLEVVTGPTVTQTGTMTAGNPTITGLTTPALVGALGVSGVGIQPGTFVLSIRSATDVTLTHAPTVTGSQALTFNLEPITLAEAKLHCRIDIPDDDTLVAGLIAAARLRVSTLKRQTLITTVFNNFMDQFPASANGYYNRLTRMMGPNPQWLPNGAAILYLPTGPLQSVQSVKYYDAFGNLQTVDPSTYFVSTGLGSRVQPVIGHVWPVVRPQIDGVAIQFTAGTASTAAGIADSDKAAMKLMISHWYEHRSEVEDAASYPVPMAVDALISATDPGIYA